jgi:hypothetical protein
MNKKVVLMENKNKRLKNGVRLAYMAPVLSVLSVKCTQSGSQLSVPEDPHFHFYGPVPYTGS